MGDGGGPRALCSCEWERTKISFVILFLKWGRWSWDGLELPLLVGVGS